MTESPAEPNSYDIVAFPSMAIPASHPDHLAVIARRLRKAGRSMRVRGAGPEITRLIEAVGLHRLPSVTVEPCVI